MGLYTSISNTLIHMALYAIPFTLLMIVWPRLIFKKNNADKLEQIIANYIKMVGLLVTIGYILVIAKIFEMFAFIFIFIALSLWRFLLARGITSEEALSSIATSFYNYMDGVFKLKPSVFLKKTFLSLKLQAHIRLINVPALFEFLLFIAVLLVSSYIRFYDSSHDFAPSLTDNLGLTWVKLIGENRMFQDGIYPKGYYLYLAVLYTFSSLDPLLVVKYTGPLISLFTVIGIYFVVSRLTASKLSGIVAATLYGVFGQLLLDSVWAGQIIGSGQQFAFMFILPTLYFYFQYLKYSTKAAFWTGAAGGVSAGLAHPGSLYLLGIGITLLVICFFIFNLSRDYTVDWKPVKKTVLAWVCIITISNLPYIIGNLCGILNNTSAAVLFYPDFLERSHLMRWIDYTAIIFASFILLHSLIDRKKDLVLGWFVFLLALSGFSIYYVGYFTKSAALFAWTIQLWAIIVSLIIGLGWHSVFQMLSSISKKHILEYSFAIALLTTTVLYAPPAPITVHKIMWNSVAEQYMRISRDFRPTTWMLVAQNEVIPLILGTGYHMYPSKVVTDFEGKSLIEDYDPLKPPLTLTSENEPDENLPQNIFILYEKQIVLHEKKDQAEQLDKRTKENAMLNEWIQIFKESNKIDIYYEDKYITVYHIFREQRRKEILDRIWGEN